MTLIHNAREREIARAEMGELIEAAARTLKRLPDKDRQILRARTSTWPSILHTAAEHAAWKPVKLRLGPPSARDISQMEDALDWLLRLAKQETKFFKAVWLTCAERRPPAHVGKILGVHRETARIWRDNGLDRLVTFKAEAESPASSHLTRSVTSASFRHLKHM